MPDPAKATIISVGSFDDNGYPTNWWFDCRGEVNQVIGLQLGETACWGGYTLEELREIAAQTAQGGDQK